MISIIFLFLMAVNDIQTEKEDNLIVLLGDDDFNQRERATEELIKRGSLKKIVETNKKTKDAEVRVRCSYIIRSISRSKPLDELDINIEDAFKSAEIFKEKLKSIEKEDYKLTVLGILFGLEEHNKDFLRLHSKLPFSGEYENILKTKEELDAFWILSWSCIENDNFKINDIKGVEIHKGETEIKALTDVKIKTKKDDIVVQILYNDGSEGNPKISLFLVLEKNDKKFKVIASAYTREYNHGSD